MGEASVTGGAPHAFSYNGMMHDLGTLGGSDSFAYGINNSGQTVGTAYLAGDQHSHAFLYDGTMHDIGALVSSAHDSKAVAINAAGAIVGDFGAQVVYGELRDSTPSHAFLYDGTVHDLGTLGGKQSWAYGINSLGQVVGSADVSVAVCPVQHAFVYSARDGMVDLNTLVHPALNWALSSAVAINGAGDIIAEGGGGPYLLTPVIPGDVNGDNVVNALDISAVAGDWLQTPNMHQDPLVGDANFDGIVNGLDIAMIASNWQRSFGVSVAATAVPEPAPLTLAALGLALSFTYRLRLANRCHGRVGRVK